MHSVQIYLRPANITELDAINRVIEKAVMSWKLPERVKRLSLPLYRYDTMDFKALQIIVAHNGRNIVGIAAWETADRNETPGNASALLLHGLYVDPAHQRKGIGQQLFRAAESAMHDQNFDGLIVKAQESADGFFLSQGMYRLDPGDPGRHYANRFWKSAAIS